MNWKSLGENISHAILEDDNEPKEVHPQEPVPPSPAVVAPTPSLDTTAAATESAAEHDDAYQRLFAKTDFETTPTFQVINSYLAPLATMALDDKTKFKVAFQQAQAKEHIQQSDVLAVFDSFKGVLQRAADLFADAVKGSIIAQVEKKKRQAAEITAQIQTLQVQVAQLTEEAFAAQQRIDAAKHRFDVALQTRTTELAQEQAKYAGLLA